MNTLLIRSLLTTAMVAIIFACTPGSIGGPGGLAGIGGSGYVSSGSVTGFGSVFVNGVEFETASATFEVDGASGTQDDLAVGMIVQVSGSINDDGISGTATNIHYDDDIQGPVTMLTAADVDGISRSFFVLGANVIVDSSSTTFDVSDGVTLPANTAFNFDSIADGNNVEISGFFDSSGKLIATRVELKDISFDTDSIVEVKGTISGLSDTTFSLAGLTIDASAATLDDLPNGLADGIYVEVKGTLDAAHTTLTASKVEAEDDAIDDTDEIELEGIITDYVDDRNFKINGIPVDASNASREPASLILANDLRIEAEGAIVNGILVATEIESEDGGIRVQASVTAVDVAASTFEVSPVSGQPAISITVTTDTQLEDDVNEIEPFTLNNLIVTDYVVVRGYEDGSGGIIANEVDVKSPEDDIVQGIIQTGSSVALSIVKVLAVEFTIDSGETEFKDANKNTLTATEFFAAITLDSTLIRVIDEDENGIADKVSLLIP